MIGVSINQLSVVNCLQMS